MLRDFAAFLDDLTSERGYEGQIVHVQTVPARAARHAEAREPLAPPVSRMLGQMGIEGLYTHQAQAIDAVRDGRDVVVVTATASGKSLCYDVPIFESLLDDPDARALCLFPTKALAHDQLRAFEAMAGLDDELAAVVKVGAYDGDTPQHNRKAIRNDARIILSNPDMLNQGVLPYHSRWSKFFYNLRYIVLDEVHTYRGIFGSNVANVVRRLRRVCDHYGATPQFICCSATIANPRELATRLIGRSVDLVDDDGSPRGRKRFVLWNPPPSEHSPVYRKSANVQAQELLSRLMREGVQTIVFTKARVVAELIYRYVRESFRGEGSSLAERVRAYRGGYLPEERREIERLLAEGEILGVTSTNALELGIDIGSLDACVIVGFPGTIASTWQQAGRAGRTSDDSLAVLVAYNDPIDQYMVKHADYFFGRSPESATLDPENPYILAGHLGCAAFELPLESEDEHYFGPQLPQMLSVLSEVGRLRHIDPKWYWSDTIFPASKVNLRTVSDDTYAIVDQTEGRNEVIGSVDSISAPELVYPEAVYLHSGETYLVRKLDQQARIAYVERQPLDYYTQPVLSSSVSVVEGRDEHAVRGGRAYYGDLDVTWQTVGFTKYKFYTMENIGSAVLDLPSQTLRTAGMWLVLSPEVLGAAAAVGAQPIEGLVGIRNMMLVVLPVLSMCDRQDISGVVDSRNTGVPTIFVYDRYAGGLGFAERGYEELDRLLAMCADLVGECRCPDGCPSCVGLPNVRPPIHQDPDAGSGYPIPSKAAARAILAAYFEGIPADAV